MKEHRLVIVYSCLILLLGSCNESPQEQASQDGIKIGDLAPVRTSGIPDRRLKSMEFDCYTFELPAENIEQLTDIWQILSTEPIHFSNQQAFTENSLAIGFSRIDTWDTAAELLRSAGAKKVATTALLLSSEQQNDIPMMSLTRYKDIRYLDTDLSLKSFTARPGQIVLRLKAKKIAGKRGVCNFYGKVVFVPKAKPNFPVPENSPLGEFSFKTTGFGLRTSPGDLLLLGPTRHVTDKKALVNIFFNTTGLKPTVRLYMLFCAGIYD
ncbi:MAG: hypothetical protein PVG93_04410 [Phycisphaerales bacterium]|jgi:hypothetical protein